MPATSSAPPRWTSGSREAGSHRLVFSGDIGRSGLPIIRDPEPPAGPIDTLIIESTYADRSHESVADAEARLGEAIRRVAARGGKLLVPAFALGRCQELVYSVHQLWRAGKIPEIPIYVDSPLAVDITTVFRMHPEVFDQRERLVTEESRLFDFPLVRYVRSVEDSKALDSGNGPSMIIAASGMAEAGRILHHLAHGIGDHRNLVLIVGFQAEHTLGRRIQEGANPVRILGEEYRGPRRGRDHRRLLGARRPRRAAGVGAPSRRSDPAGLRGARRARCARGDGQAGPRRGSSGRARCPNTARPSSYDRGRAGRRASQPARRRAAPPLGSFDRGAGGAGDPPGLHGGTGRGPGVEPARPAPGGGRHHRARRGAVQRAPVARPAGPAGPRARSLPRRVRAAHRRDRRGGAGRHDE